MNKKFSFNLLLVMLLISFSAISQTTNVPDDNFENYLETHDAFGQTVTLGAANSMGNGIANDNLVETSRVNSVSTLIITNLNIADLTGIEDFAVLEELWCFSNQLIALDVSQNTALTELNCSNNLLTTLDISQNTALTGLGCEDNQLATMDVSQNIALIEIHFDNNQLTTLDISQNTEIAYLYVSNNMLQQLNIANGNNTNISAFYSQNNPDLACIEVDDVAYSNTNWPDIDPASSFSEDCSLTTVPDDNFENYLETHDADSNVVALGAANSMGNGIANDNLVFTNRINTVTRLIINSLSITDLTGIEDFVALTGLFCFSNQLTDLNVSQNTALLVLQCDNNLLTTLDVSQNTTLVILTFYENQLTTIDLSQNTALEQLNFQSNQITTLDLSRNTALEGINCSYNQLTTLDISQNTEIVVLYTNNNMLQQLNIANGNNINFSNFDFDIQNNPDLTCIEVDNVAYSNANWMNIDPASSFSDDCGLTTVPDNNFETYLETHDANGNVVTVGAANSMGNGVANDNIVNTSQINTVTSLSVGFLDITDLTGIEDFVALTGLSCFGNQLTALDVSQNTALTFLNCQNNQITDLDLSQNTALTVLQCFNNQLTTMNLSANTALGSLHCVGNNLTYLNVANGNNTSFSLFISDNNPDLTCIEVDNTAYSNANWTNIDPASSFSEDCDLTVVPDDNFENYLETHSNNGTVVTLGAANSMGNGIANDNFVPTSRINTVTSLSVGNLSITDLTGIEDFTALSVLNCYSNQLTALDVSQNTALTNLNCVGNQITDLDFSQNPALQQLFTDSNLLSTLNVSQNTALTFLFCDDNQLTELDVTQNTALTLLNFQSNLITALDVSQNTALEAIYGANNQLTTLDISQNTEINVLSINNNRLQQLNVANGNNINFSNFNSQNNPDLTCIEVDDRVYSNTNWSNRDLQTAFSENCGEVVVSPNAYLQGALPLTNPRISEHRGDDLVKMRDDLRTLGLIPLNSPYDGVPLPDSNILNTGGISGAGSDSYDIVDWVWVELRDDVDPSIIIDGQSALINREGTITNLDGTYNLVFIQPAKHYNVVVKHRNHSAIMSATRQAFPLNQHQEFISGTTSTLGSNSQYEFQPTSFAMWAGDINGNGQINFSGSNNDTNAIKDGVLADPANAFNSVTFTSSGYLDYDLDLNGNGKFSGANNDGNIIKDNILAHPGNGFNSPTFTIISFVP